jgi:Uri superfamily endonuclease
VAEINIPTDRGTYALILRNDGSGSVRIGALGEVTICPGYYIYIGSAFGPGGLRARISRHVKTAKKMHWHIDYLRPHTDLAGVWFDTHSAPREHTWAQGFNQSSQMDVPFPRFGASDCHCASHLFYCASAPALSEFEHQLESRVDKGLGIWRQDEVTF